MLFVKRTSVVFLSFVQIFYIASVCIFYVFSRYRMPVLPLFCLTAGYGFFVLQSQLRMGQWQRLVASFVILGLGWGIAHHQVIKPFDFSHSYTDEGIAYETKDDEQGALTSYIQALEINPKYLRALDRLAKLQMKRKDYKEARATYKKILTIEPDSVEAKYQLMWLEKEGL